MKDTFQFLLKANDSLNQIVNSLSSNQKIVEQQSAIIDGLNSNIEILGIWVAIVSIAFPIAMSILNYFNYKGLTRKINESIRNQNKESIQSAFKKLDSEDKTEMYNASLFLSNQFDFKFNEKELNTIIVKYGKSEDSFLKMNLKNILINNPTLCTDKFFRNIMVNEDMQHNIFNIFRFLYNSNSDFSKEFVEYINKSLTPISDFYSLVATSIHISPDFARNFLNNKLIIDKLSTQPITELTNSLINFTGLFSQGTYGGIIDFENSLFYKKVFDLKSEADKNNADSIVIKESSNVILDLLNEKGLKISRSKIVDKDGNEYKSEQIAYTALGPAKIIDVIEIEGKYIPINDIKTQNKSKK